MIVGSVAALAVADGAGQRAGAVRADAHLLQAGGLLDAGDRAAPGADGVDVEHRHGDVATADRGQRRDRRLAAVDERHVATRAAHVEGDEVLIAGRAAERDTGHHAAGGPDRIVVTARSAPTANEATPPFDCIR